MQFVQRRARALSSSVFSAGSSGALPTVSTRVVLFFFVPAGESAVL